MGPGVSGLVWLFDGGVSDGMRLARPVLGDGIAMGVVLFGQRPC